MFKHWCLAVCVALVAIVTLVGCNEDVDYLFSSYTMDANGGTIQAANGTVELDFPQNAISQVTIITVEAMADAPDGVVPGTVYDISAVGLTAFNAPVELTMTYSPDSTAGLDPQSFKLYRKQASNGETVWVELADSTVDTIRHTVTAHTDELGTYAIIGNSL